LCSSTGWGISDPAVAPLERRGIDAASRGPPAEGRVAQSEQVAQCHSDASEASEESAEEKLVDSAPRIEFMRGIGQMIFLQIPPRALRALVEMTL
jgi:hypothetical protein